MRGGKGGEVKDNGGGGGEERRGGRGGRGDEGMVRATKSHEKGKEE